MRVSSRDNFVLPWFKKITSGVMMKFTREFESIDVSYFRIAVD